MNRTLESIAHAIFKSWFVDFDPVRKKMEGKTGSELGLPPSLAVHFPDSLEGSANRTHSPRLARRASVGTHRGEPEVRAVTRIRGTLRRHGQA